MPTDAQSSHKSKPAPVDRVVGSPPVPLLDKLDYAHESYRKDAAEAATEIRRLLAEVTALEAALLKAQEVSRAVERKRCAKVAKGAHTSANNGSEFENGWCSAALQIEQAIRMNTSNV